MLVRPLLEPDIPAWISLRAQLWPEEMPSELERQGRLALDGDPPLIVLVATESNQLMGFIEIGLRSYAEGCSSSPVPYIEGWFVASNERRRGVGTALMEAAQAWARQGGFAELGSDTQPVNQISRSAHEALGFQEVEQLVVFRKDLTGPET